MANYLQSQAASGSFVVSLGPNNNVAGALATTNVGSFTVPPVPQSNGIRVTGVSIHGSQAASDPDVDVNVYNGVTSILSAAVTITGNRTVTATLANNGQEYVKAGSILRVSAVDGGSGDWDSTEVLCLNITVNYQKQPR